MQNPNPNETPAFENSGNASELSLNDTRPLTPAPFSVIPDSLLGQTVADKYAIERLLGRGGAGEVYLANQIELDRPVAFKVLRTEIAGRPDSLERFRREARIAARLHHPNIVAVYDFGMVADRHAFIVMEYLPGQSLRDYIEANPGGLALRDAAVIFRQMAAGVHAAHLAGYVHRDLKPGNVMVESGVGDEPIVKVLDFGIAKIADERYIEGVNDLTGKALLGTPHYCSPEQAVGDPVDSRSDIYSLGLTLYVMLTGELPFNGPTPAAIIVQHATKPPRPPREIRPDIPIALEKVILRSLAKSPDDRPGTALEFAAAVTAAVDAALGFETVAAPIQTGTSFPVLPDTPTPTMFDPSGLLPLDRRHDTGESSGSSSGSMRARRRLAVIPFRNLAAQPDIEFLGFSLADSIISQMAYVKNLIVRPTSAVERLSTSIETTEIARRIDVDTILTGTYLKAGDRFRVNTQLVDVHPNEILWREQFDVPFGDILALQDRITEKIVSGLNISLSTEEKENLHAETPRSLTAYELYLRAKDHGEGVEGFKNAIDLLKQSLELDPSYAPAWAELADCHLMIAFGGLGGRDHYIEAENAARRALDLNPGLLAAHFVMLAAYGQTGRVTESMQTCLTLLHAAPSSEFTHLGLGHLYEYNGELDRALRAFNRARRINPIHLTTFTQAAAIYIHRGEDEKALQFLTNDVCQEHECGTKAYLLGVLAFRAGDRDTAYRHFSTSARVDNRSIFGRLSLGAQLKLEGNKDAGLAILEEVSRKVTSGDWLFFLAHPFMMAFHQPERAIEMLEQSVELGYCNVEGLEHDPVFEPLRQEPRYLALLDRARAIKAERQPMLDQLMALEDRLSTFYSGTDSL